MTLTYQAAKASLKELVATKGLPAGQADILETLALDDYGFQLSAAPSILAGSLNRSAEDCSEALTALSGTGLVLTVSNDSHLRIIANYQALGATEELRQALRQGHPTPFEQLDAPHSAEAMATLHALFVEEPQPIFLGLEMTAHRVFQKLTERAEAGRMTTFLMPHKSLIDEGRHRQYDEVLHAWKQFLRNLTGRGRSAVRLRITRVPYHYLYTSAVSPNFVRFNCYWYDQGTTRRGVMVRASKGSSLYDLVQREYAEAVHLASPIWSVWPVEWIRHKVASYAPLVITALLVVLAYILESKLGAQVQIAKYVAIFFLGLAGESFWDFYKSRRRTPRGLYRS